MSEVIESVIAVGCKTFKSDSNNFLLMIAYIFFFIYGLMPSVKTEFGSFYIPSCLNITS